VIVSVDREVVLLMSYQENRESTLREGFALPGMISKPTIIITSLGRTGTKFFSMLLGEIIPDATSLHEPDVWNILEYQGTSARIRETLRQMQESGACNLTLRRFLGRWSLIELSDARVRGRLSIAEAARRVLNQRREFVQTRNGSVYVEANIGYYGLIDALKDVYKHYKVAYIVRDGRDWLQSHMDWGEMYGKGKFRSLFAHTWPTAFEMEHDPYGARWNSMSRFERICWAWARFNEYAIRTVHETPNAQLFRFEDLFKSEEGYQHLEQLVQFVTTFPSADQIGVGSSECWLDRQIHRSLPRHPPWEEWTAEQKLHFRTLCGPLMRELGYEFE
jgi:hypothetical protein